MRTLNPGPPPSANPAHGDRYYTAGNPEGKSYPGTSALITLKDIREPEELLERETELHLATYEEMFRSFDERLITDLPFFYYLHHMIFSTLYVWAGRPRTVGTSKGRTPFRPPENINATVGALFSVRGGEGEHQDLERGGAHGCPRLPTLPD